MCYTETVTASCKPSNQLQLCLAHLRAPIKGSYCTHRAPESYAHISKFVLLNLGQFKLPHTDSIYMETIFQNLAQEINPQIKKFYTGPNNIATWV